MTSRVESVADSVTQLRTDVHVEFNSVAGRIQALEEATTEAQQRQARYERDLENLRQQLATHSVSHPTTSTIPTTIS
jgi:molecular chaperone GrpE (heat shock protein)